MRPRSWAAVSASATLTALVCGFVVLQGPTDPSAQGSSPAAGARSDVPVVQTGEASVETGSQAAAPSGPTPKPAAVAASAAASATPSATRGSDEGVQTGLSSRVRGKAAVKALGANLPAVAARAGLSSEQLREVLLSDPTAWVTPSGRVQYREAIPTAPEQAVGWTATPLTAPYPLANTLKLHSLPGSNHTIYLDFDGVTVSATNAWHAHDGLPTGTYAGWDPAGDGPAFNDDERAGIQEIWARVAEDYAAFDVDVTTEAPSQDALSRLNPNDPTFGTHVVVTGSESAWNGICGTQCGGVAWTGLIDDSVTQWGGAPDVNEIAWVFSGAVESITGMVAEVASHETGHTFGLTHDGDDPQGDSYYAPDDGEGDKVWAPIMGAAYYNAVTQWSKGDYPNARNWIRGEMIAPQDDVAIIRGIAGTRSTPTSSLSAPLTVEPDSTRYLTRSSQADILALGHCAAGSAVAVHSAEVGANVDVSLSIVDGSGRRVTDVLGSSNPKTTQEDAGAIDPWNPSYLVEKPSGLGAEATLPVAGGPYFAVVRGAGNLGGDWTLGGYDNYASLGAYGVAVTGCDLESIPGSPSAEVPEVPQDLAAEQSPAGTLLTWAAPVANDGAQATHYLVQIDGADPLAVEGDEFLARNLTAGSHLVAVRAVNAAGVGPAATAAITVIGIPGRVSSLAAIADPARHSVSVRWKAPTSGGAVTGYGLTLSSGAKVIAQRTFATLPSSVRVEGMTPGRFTATVTARNIGGSSTTAVGVMLAAPPTAPARPTAKIKAGKKGGKKTVVLTWKVPAQATAPRPTAYRITIYRVVKGKVKVVKKITATSTATKREVKLALKKGVKYSYTVQVHNSVGWSPASKRSKAVAPK